MRAKCRLDCTCPETSYSDDERRRCTAHTAAQQFMNSLVKSVVRSERWLSLSEIKSARIGGVIRLGLADKEGGINFRSSSWPPCCGMPHLAGGGDRSNAEEDRRSRCSRIRQSLLRKRCRSGIARIPIGKLKPPSGAGGQADQVRAGEVEAVVGFDKPSLIGPRRRCSSDIDPLVQAARGGEGLRHWHGRGVATRGEQ